MSDSKETKHLEVKRKSKKVKSSFNLMDFLVVKSRKKKTQPAPRLKVKQIQKRGKVRKRRITTIKKRILRDRREKRVVLEALKASNDQDTEDLAESLAKVQLEVQPELESCRTDAVDIEAVSSCNEVASNRDDSTESLKISTSQPEASATISNTTPATSNKPTEESPSCHLHSRNFREYCNLFITPEIRHFTVSVLKDLFKFQENKFQQNPIKAKANKRYVVGFKEVKKFLVVKRLKLVIIAPDLERNAEVEKLVDEIKTLADQHSIPYVFSIKRRHIGYLLLKKVPVSLVGIFDYQGTNENVSELLKFVEQQKIEYNTSKSS